MQNLSNPTRAEVTRYSYVVLNQQSGLSDFMLLLNAASYTLRFSECRNQIPITVKLVCILSVNLFVASMTTPPCDFLAVFKHVTTVSDYLVQVVDRSTSWS
jgi:hypothetical protein